MYKQTQNSTTIFLYQQAAHFSLIEASNEFYVLQYKMTKRMCIFVKVLIDTRLLPGAYMYRAHNNAPC